MEGIAGVTDVSDVHPEKEDYKFFREQMTLEVAAACEGAIKAGATDILVKDAHWFGRNIDARKLPKIVRMVRGWSGHPMNMMESLDESYHAVLLIGYHSRAGSGANPLSHTLSGKMIAEMKINDLPASEFLVSTWSAAYVDVPVAFLSGDEGLCAEVSSFNESIVTVSTFKGIGAGTVSIHPDLALEKIREGVTSALKKNIRDYLRPLPKNFCVEIKYHTPYLAYSRSFYPRCKQISDNKITFEDSDFFEVLRMIKFATL